MGAKNSASKWARVGVEKWISFSRRSVGLSGSDDEGSPEAAFVV